MPQSDVAVLVPVKSFASAKLRLAPAVDADERDRLAREMAATVLAAASPLPVAVVCDDPVVAAWARDLGAQVVWTPGHGLNAAVQRGLEVLTTAGASQVVVAHADLPLARDLSWVASFDGITVVPDRRLDGTNVLCIPRAVPFRFAYGAGSFARHCAEARRHGVAVRLVRSAQLAWDVDVPDDLAYARP